MLRLATSLCQIYSTWNVNTDRDGNHVSDKAVGFRHATGEREFAPFSQLSSCVIQGHLRVFDLSFDLGTIKYDPPLILLIKYTVHYSCIEGLSGWNIFLMVSRAFGTLWAKLNNNNNNLLHLYSIFLDTQSALHSKGAISSSTTNVQHPPGWCDGSHSAPECPPHTSLLVERRQSDEVNQCMGMIRRPWWSEASGLVWPGCRSNTPTLFRRTSWDF